MSRQSKARGGSARASVQSLIRHLSRDTAGNTLGISLATIILLISLAGSGIDMSRAYMTKTSLQSACDAGVLAGRKAMSSSGSYGTTAISKANKMFNFNFNPNATNATSITFNTSSTSTGAVTGTATTTMPTVVMGVFGFKSIAMTVACSAELQMASADVMFVLDTTGSMLDTPSNGYSNGGPDSKIQGLRDAVRSFYKTVANAVTDKVNTRIRFGFVPYSQSVNVSGLVTSGAMPASYLSDTAPYQTALAKFDTPVQVGTAGTPVASTETYGSDITQSNCNNYGANKYPTNIGSPVAGGGPAPTATTSTAYSYKSWTKVSGSGNSALGTCVRNKTVTSTTYVTRYQFTNWIFQAATLDVASFKNLAAGKVAVIINSNATVPNSGTYDMPTLGSMVGNTGVTGITNHGSPKWDGCVEERATVVNLAMSPVPSGATDLDMDSAPTDDATRWKMHIPEVEWYRGSTDTTSRTETSTQSDTYRQASNCPAPAKLFTTVDTSNPAVVPSWLDSYVDTLVAQGSTYHDIGMIWGGRLASASGMFQTNVTEDSTKYPSVSRHIIFMTDGLMAPLVNVYSAYGQELYDNRVAPSGTSSNTLINYHNNRYLAACAKAKNLGYTIWVIGFGTGLTTQMKACATAGRAYYASDTTALNNTFKYIAGQVADLRINK